MIKAIIQIIVALVFLVDFAMASGGADALVPAMRFGGYFLHLIAFLLGLVGLMKVTDGAKAARATKAAALVSVAALIVGALVVVHSLAADATGTLLRDGATLAATTGGIRNLPDGIADCARGNPSATRVIVEGGSGFTQYFVLRLECNGQVQSVIAKRKTSGWEFFADV